MRSKKIKRVIQMIEALIIMMFLFCACKTEAHADTIKYVDKTLSEVKAEDRMKFIDGCIVTETYNKKASPTSSRTYSVVGFSITRCKIENGKPIPHNGENSEYIVFVVTKEYHDATSDTEEVYLKGSSNVYKYSTWSVPITDIISKIEAAGYHDWAQEMKSYFLYNTYEGDYCLKWDNIVRVNKRNKNGILVPQGGLYPDGEKYDMCYSNYPDESDSYPWEQGSGIAQLKALFPNSKSGLDTYFNNYINKEGLWKGSSNSAFDPSEDVTSLYETKNVSREFDLSKGIPTAETVENTVNAATFTGNEIDVEEKLQSASGYRCTVRYIYKYTEPDTTKLVISFPVGHPKLESSYLDPKFSKVYNPETNKVDIFMTVKGSTIEKQVHQELISLKATVGYNFVASAPSIYQLDSMKVHNSAFPNQMLVYDENNLTVPQVNVLMQLYCADGRKGSSPYLTVSNGMDVDSINYAPLGENSHYAFCKSFPSSLSPIVINVSPSAMKGDTVVDFGPLNSAKNSVRYDLARIVSDNTWSRNDYISINDGKTSFKLMDSAVVKGAVVTDTLTGAVVYNGTYASKSSNSYGAGTNVTMKKINENLLARRAGASQNVTIPFNVDNGDYPTKLEVKYKNIFKSSDGTYSTATMYAGLHFFGGVEADLIYNHVMKDGYGAGHIKPSAINVDGDGYPIRVHTPIIAPISIVKNDGSLAYEQTQLIAGYSFNPDATNQLLLDNHYYVKWDNELWQSNIYGSLEGYEDVYDKYVSNKYLRFPFTVIYNNTLYEKKASTGFTDWILVDNPDEFYGDWNVGVNTANYESANHWQMTPFYIPSFAEEGGMPDADEYYVVEAKVEAINAYGKYLGGHSFNIEMQQNTSKHNYVAQTRIGVQLSGLVYDFSVTGTNNAVVYTGKVDTEEVNDIFGVYSFANIRQERKAGILNRLGTPYTRFLRDGYVVSNLDSMQTLPIRDGQSLALPWKGDLWRGQWFGYTIKTMANLDGPNDRIEITPSFVYVSSDGEILKTENDEVKIFGVLDNKQIWEYNPDHWEFIEGETGSMVSLDEDVFEETYYDSKDKNAYTFGEWLKTSAENENADHGHTDWVSAVTEQEYLKRKTQSFGYDHVTIPATLRLLSGEWEQLASNIGKYYDDVTLQGSMDTYKGVNGYNYITETRFKYSMQQWHSVYALPQDTYIIDVRDKGGADFDIERAINGCVDGWTWTNNDVLEDMDGKLVLHFDIVVYKDGKPYLSYIGQNPYALNMWDREGYVEGTVTDTEGFSVPIRDGDVAIIDLTHSMDDYHYASIWDIN